MVPTYLRQDLHRLNFPLPSYYVSRTFGVWLARFPPFQIQKRLPKSASGKRPFFVSTLSLTREGALATLSFIGATWARNAPFRPALIPLSCFILGIILAGFSVQGELMGSLKPVTRGRKENNIPDSVITAIAIRSSPPLLIAGRLVHMRA